MSSSDHDSMPVENVGPDATSSASWRTRGRRLCALALAALNYLWQETIAVAKATASQTARLVQCGIALGNSQLAAQKLAQARFTLGEKLYQRDVGDQSSRDSIRALDAKIEEKRAAKQSASTLLADRRRLCIQLAEATASSSSPTVDGPEMGEVLSCQRELEECNGAVKAAQVGLKPRNLVEAWRVAMGGSIIVTAIVAFGFLLSVRSPGGSDMPNSDRTIAEGSHTPPNEDIGSESCVLTDQSTDLSGSHIPARTTPFSPSATGASRLPGYMQLTESSEPPENDGQNSRPRVYGAAGYDSPPGWKRPKGALTYEEARKAGVIDASGMRVRSETRGLARMGFARDTCLVCSAQRSDGAKAAHSDRHGFGLCERCGCGVRTMQQAFAFGRQGMEPPPDLIVAGKQFGEFLNACANRDPRTALIATLIPFFGTDEWDALTRGE